MKKVTQFAVATALFVSVVASVSAASYDLDFTLNDGFVTAPTLYYQYTDEQTLSVSGLTSYNQNQGVIQGVDVSGVFGMGLWTNGNTGGITNAIGGASGFSSQYQMLLLDFGQEVSLNTFKLEFSYTVNDYVTTGNYGAGSVLAYSDKTLPDLSSSRWGDILSMGFNHAGGVDDYKNLPNSQDISVRGGLVSQYWLLGAFNPIFGGSADGSNSFLFLAGISFSTGNVSEVPLPAAAWLFLTGLAGVGWIKKRKARADKLALASA